LTQAIPRPPRHLHQAEYYQAIGVALGIEPGDRFARVTIRDSHLAHARELLESRGFDGTRPFVVLAPGAAYGRAKQWLPERFAQLAAQLAHDGIASVLVGARGDADACDVVARHVAAINLVGATDLPTLAAVLSLSRAVVSNDSGAMHLAGAAGARVIGIFGPTDERRTSPLRSDASAQLPVIVATDVWCRPCMLRECPIDHRCMSEISAERVRTAVEAP
jgi:heptosyltransferase-2